jgi:hypothetical protein
MQMSGSRSRLTNLLGYAHLAYLGALPALATFSLLLIYGHSAPLLLLLGGTVAVSVYLAVIITYTPLPPSLGWSLVLLLDGPAWVTLSLRSAAGVTPLAFAIEGFLIDGTAIWISILILAIGSALPTKQQRRASVGFMLAALAATAWLVWPYYRHVLLGHWLSQSLLGLGIIEAAIVRYKVLKRDEVVRSNNVSVPYLISLLLLWVVALIVGNILHQWG